MRLRITESQLKRIIKQLTENNNRVLNVMADTDANGNVTTSSLHNTQEKVNGVKGNFKTVNVVAPVSEVSESRVYKKAQLKEARRNKLNQNARYIRKGNI